MATCDPKYPIREWDRLLEQAELTLNLLRNSRVNPSLSSWAYLFGNHDFNKVPLVPPGTKVILHSRPNDRASWDFHGIDGWYIGPAPHHYRCVKCYVPKTHSERITDTVTLLPHTIPIPKTSLDDHIRATSDNLISLLYRKKSPIGPFITPSTQDHLIKLAKLFHRDKTTPTHDPPSPQSSIVSKTTSPPTPTPTTAPTENQPKNSDISSPSNPTSEGDQQTSSTSEGDHNTTSIIREINTNIRPVQPHPGLYPTKNPTKNPTPTTTPTPTPTPSPGSKPLSPAPSNNFINPFHD